MANSNSRYRGVKRGTREREMLGPRINNTSNADNIFYRNTNHTMASGTRSSSNVGIHEFSERYAPDRKRAESSLRDGTAATNRVRHHRRRDRGCVHTPLVFSSPLSNTDGGYCIYMLHTETANKRGADLNNVSSNSVLARCDVVPLFYYRSKPVWTYRAKGFQ